MPKKLIKQDVTEDPRYHDTWRLLKKYRDVVWSLELSVQQMKNQFQIEYGSSIEDFWNLSIWLALTWVVLNWRITLAALSAATKCSPWSTTPLNCSVPITSMARTTTGCCIIRSFPLNNLKMWKKSSNSSALISGTSVSVHTTGNGRRRLRR